MRALTALNVQGNGFGAECAGADNNARYANKMGDIGGREAADGGLRDGGMDEELMFGEGGRELLVFFALGGVEDTARTDAQRGFELVQLISMWRGNVCV